MSVLCSSKTSVTFLGVNLSRWILRATGSPVLRVQRNTSAKDPRPIGLLGSYLSPYKSMAEISKSLKTSSVSRRYYSLNIFSPITHTVSMFMQLYSITKQRTKQTSARTVTHLGSLPTEVEKDMHPQTKNTSTLKNFTHLSFLMLK